MQAETEFEERWAENKVHGWGKTNMENGDVSLIIDLDYYNSSEELMEVGAEKLKEVFLALNQFLSGVSERQICNRVMVHLYFLIIVIC